MVKGQSVPETGRVSATDYLKRLPSLAIHNLIYFYDYYVNVVILLRYNNFTLVFIVLSALITDTKVE